MRRTMSFKGFVLILAAGLTLFFVLHAILGGSVDERTQKQKELKVRLTRLQEENKELQTKISAVDTEDYIRSSAVKNYSFVQKDAIRFEYTNPEAIYGYTAEELEILLDEISEGGND